MFPNTQPHFIYGIFAAKSHDRKKGGTCKSHSSCGEPMHFPGVTYSTSTAHHWVWSMFLMLLKSRLRLHWKAIKVQQGLGHQGHSILDYMKQPQSHSDFQCHRLQRSSSRTSCWMSLPLKLHSSMIQTNRPPSNHKCFLIEGQWRIYLQFKSR